MTAENIFKNEQMEVPNNVGKNWKVDKPRVYSTPENILTLKLYKQTALSYPGQIFCKGFLAAPLFFTSY